MDGWMDGWEERWMGGCIDEQLVGQINGQWVNGKLDDG
jgi:hypothetical protein